jgi:hypothetical protein
VISTNAGSSRDRVTRSRAPSSARWIAAFAASTCPCASRSRARPGCGSRPELDALLVATGQVRRRGKPLEIIGRERRLLISGRQLGERTGPSAPAEQLPAAIECIHRRGVCSDASSGSSASRGAPRRASVPARHECILRLVDQAYRWNGSRSMQIATALARGAAACTLPLRACSRAARRSRLRRSK